MIDRVNLSKIISLSRAQRAVHFPSDAWSFSTNWVVPVPAPPAGPCTLMDSRTSCWPFSALPPCISLPSAEINFDNIFPPNAKMVPVRFLNGLLEDHLYTLLSQIVIASDATLSEDKTGVGIFSKSLYWSYSVRLPHYTPIFQAELLTVIVVLERLQHTFSDVVVLFDSYLSVCTALTPEKDSLDIRIFRSFFPTGFVRWASGGSTTFGDFVPWNGWSIIQYVSWWPRGRAMPKWQLPFGGDIQAFPTTSESSARRSSLFMDYNHLTHEWKPKFCKSRI